MSSSASPQPSSNAGSGQIPAIRTFQLDSGSIGNLPSSVNLFRGDVNLNQTLFTLPGRKEDDGLDVNVSLQYQSNVFRQATTWNREAPTGVAGLGWQLPLTFIAAIDQGSPVPATRRYSLYDNGSPNQLARQPQAPKLFSMDSSLASGLADGRPVPQGILDAFRAHGLALAASATVEGSGPWTLADGAGQQLFTLELTGGDLVAYDGGEAYQLQSYQFWKILYYPRYERWLVVTDNAVRRSFGGLADGAPPNRGPGRNDSIAWEVWWTGAGGEPLWRGPSTVTAGQTRIASAWYLASVGDRFGNSVGYAYDAVEQAVGAGGLAYTKATYLSRVTDVFGRTVDFTYGDKLWSDGDADPREYADPHRAVPSDDPGPYQDRYETRYLERLDVRSAAGETLFTVTLNYDPRPDAEGRDREVANVTSYEGRLVGDTFKRFLTSITLADQDGVPQPGVELGYHLTPVDPAAEEAADDGTSPGALATIIYPEGGTAAYSYTRQDLDICQRTQEVPRPSEVPSGASPRVYFGPDYAVVCYYNQSSLELSMQVFTWAGTWLAWQLDDASSILDTGGLDLGSLEVLADDDVIALHFERTTPAETAVYVFQRDVARPGQWQAAKIDGKTTAKNSPPLTFSGAGSDVTFAGGATFFAVANMDRSQLKGTIDVATFRWTTREWTLDRFTADRFSWLTAGGDYFATLDITGRFAVRYLDGTLVWRDGTPGQLDGLSTFDLDSVDLSPGAALVAVSNLQSSNQQQNTYAVWTVQWNASYVVAVEKFGPFTDQFGQGNAPTPWRPQVVSDTLVAVNGNLLRYGGGRWLVNTRLNPGAVPAGRTQRYAFGPDYALQIVAPTTGTGAAEGKVLAFDPATDSTAWASAPVTPKQPLPPQVDLTRNWPTSGGGDWAVMGPHLYFRGVADDWGAVVAEDALADLDAILAAAGFALDSESLVDEAPDFLAFTATQGSSVQQVQALLLDNGRAAGAQVPFSQQRMVTPGRDGIAGPGVSPAGPAFFVAYPASAPSFNDAASIFLHRYTDDAVDGPITHYPVTGLVIDDGYQEPMPSAFAPDGATAGCDASGQVVKYFQTTVFPGSTDARSPRYGRSVNFYLNGLNDLTGDNFYDMLDGLLIRTETYDAAGELKERSETTYEVFEQIAPDAGDPAAEPLPLRGGWVAQIAETDLRDGVTTRQTNGYVAEHFTAPFISQPVTTTMTSFGGAGKAEDFVRQVRYGVEVDTALRAVHSLVQPAQQTTLRKPAGGGDGVVVQSLATTYSGWPSAIGEKVSAPATEASFALLDAASDRFPFAGYRPGDTPAGWQLGVRTLARTAYGQQVEVADALGVPSSTIYATDALVAVADADNATPDGWAYLGFQPYEDVTRWTLTGVTYDDGDARTGVRSARLAAGANASAAVAVTPRDAASPYLVGCWYKTPSGYTPTPSAGWTVVVTAGGARRPAIAVPFAATEGEWAYQTIPVPLDGATGALSVALTAANGSAFDVLLDALLAMPLHAALTARTFAMPEQLVTATMDSSGRTSRTYYDRAWQPTASVGASGRVRELAQRFLSRKGSPDGRFQPASPNAEATLHPAAGGLLETFRDGGAWQRRWQTSGGGWQASDGALNHGTSAAGTLTSRQPSPAGTWAVYFELQTARTDAGALALSITAGDVTVERSAGRYVARQGGTAWTPLVQPPDLARHWLLVVGDGAVLFFADGQLVFSRKARPAGDGLAIATSGAAATFRHLATVGDVRLGLTYNDAAARQRQVHQLHGAGSIAAEVIFDPLGRQVATTRNAPAAFGSGAALAVLQYSPGFVDVGAFLANLDGSWEMSGDVADYYRGQQEGPVKRSDDEGYPYRGVRYEDSPRNLRLEVGQPGKPYAIDLRVPAAERQTVQYAFGSNDAGSGLPADEYYRDTLTSPVKTDSVRLLDQLGQLVATRYDDAGGQLVTSTDAGRAYTDAGGRPQTTLTTRLPNATTAGPQSDPAAFVEVSTIDPLQRTVSLRDADSGFTQFVNDGAGRLRFVQPALDPGETWFIYYKYDALGRIVEEGTVAQAFDRQTLEQRADDPAYPTANTSPVVTISYDGDGSVATLIGKKQRTVSLNRAPAGDPQAGDLTVTETFGYDPAGHMTSVRQQVAGALAADATIGYAYNVLGEVLRVDAPQGAPLPQVHYGYDDLGRVTAVGTTPGGADLGAYQFSADGEVEVESLAGGAWQQAIDYASPGWTLSIAARSAAGDQRLDLDYTYLADGAVETRQAALEFTAGRASQDETFAYDGQRRLQSASGTNDVTIRQYDPNGNIWQVEQDGAEQRFTCAAGSDRLASVTLGGDTTPVAYNARGQLVSGVGRTLTYEAATAMTTSVATGAAALRYAYGGTQQRVVKQRRAGGGGDVVYFNGAGRTPVVRFEDGAWSTLVQGPRGLLLVATDRRLYPLKDAIGSTWAVVDGDALAARYAYLPFGQQVDAADPGGVAFPYLFQSQEWDAEVGLYAFGARLYDPLLRRFLAPDPARQFASLYVFAGNDPLIFADPSGDISVWAQVGIGAALVAVTAVGIGLTLFTGGASDAAAASVDAALIGAEAGTEAAAVATGEAAATGAAEAAAGAAEGAAAAGVAEGAAAGAEGAAAAGASEVAAGASATEAAAGTAATGSSWSSTLTTLAVNVAGSTLSGAGTSGLQYDIQHGRDFTAKGFFEAVGIGAASGFVSGAVGGVGGLAAGGLTAGIEGGAGVAARIGSKALVGAVSGTLSADVSTVLTNVAQHQPWYQGLAKASVTGFAKGAATGAASGAWGERTDLARMAGVSDQQIQRITTVVDRVQTAATSETAYAIYGTAAFFVVSGYVVWGAADNWGRGN